MYRPIIRKENGFTLLSELLNMLIFMIAAQILCLIIIIYYQHMNLKDDRDEMEWLLFVNDLNIYLERSHSVEVTMNGFEVSFLDPVVSNKIKYRFVVGEDEIARRSTDGGYEIILPNISKAIFSLNGGILKVNVTMKSGKVREREFAVATFKK